MMRKMLLLSIATVLTAVGVAGATSSGSANLAGPFCVDKANGTVHAVAADVACKSNQIRKSGLSAAAGTNGTNGAAGPQGAQGGQGAKGDAGGQGVAGLQGADGATGAAGAKGATGANGPAGPAGASGLKGLPGLQGFRGNDGRDGKDGTNGSSGAAGAVGATGPAGAAGTAGKDGTDGAAGSSPLVFGPYASSSLDSNICGGNWATDTFTRTFIVAPQADGSFVVTELYNGTYTTIAGPSANDCNVQVAGGLTGKFYGDESILLPAGADFNFNAQITGDVTGTSFFNAVFGVPFPSNYAWQFHYVSDGGTAAGTSQWDNTDHGNVGNIA